MGVVDRHAVVYDVTSRASFDHLNDWLGEIDMYCNSADVVKLLVANKIDKDGREVSREDGAAFARALAMVFIECSAKTKLGIQQAFEELVHKVSFPYPPILNAVQHHSCNNNRFWKPPVFTKSRRSLKR